MGTMADVTQIITDMGSISTWFWSIFSTMLNTITSNSLLLYLVVFAIVAGSVGMAMKVVRKFGVKGRR